MKIFLLSAPLIHKPPSRLSWEIIYTSCILTSEVTSMFPQSLKDPGHCFYSPHMALNLVSLAGVKWPCWLHSCYFVFQWSCGQIEFILNFLSLLATVLVLMPREGTGSDRFSPMTLYGVFLKNKVNKTWSAKLWILIICLWLWGRRGDAARMRKKVSRREGKGIWNIRGETEKSKEVGEQRCFDAFRICRHQWDGGD